MFRKLVSHNDDLRRLVEKGYAVAFDSNYLIVRDIPYLDSAKQLQIGSIVASLFSSIRSVLGKTITRYSLPVVFRTARMGLQSVTLVEVQTSSH